MNHRLRITDILGGVMENPVRNTIRLFVDRHSIVFFGLAALVLYVSDLSDFRPHVAPVWGFVIWPFGLALYLGLYSLMLILAAAVQRRLATITIPTLVLGALALSPAVALCEWLAETMSSSRYEATFLPHFLMYFVVAQAFETIFLNFVFPLSALRTAPADASLPSSSIMVAGEEVETTRVLYIEAKEHLVNIRLDGRTITHRARLGDLVAQTRAEDGFQPHRSWWVSRSAAPRLTRDGQRYVLELSDNSKVPVARNRINDVRDWLDGQGQKRA
ncbi:LytTR family DNA-binding domain-containing protein [Pseudoprimorskyibacter insulae]|uniref:LytTR family DNA-binding domain-containing protein n=1 Tax=Pseudoprimorskyibacter insulae TaxID=1695997 RepID=UPI000D55E842|nr:LytTR family DNA-binding domain-containing protein [Pseudoprimorskyibacter insulae]